MQLLGLNTKELENALAEMGEKPFRGRQIASWIYKRGATSFDDMSDLSQSLREKLSSTHTIEFPRVTQRYHSRDGSTKLLLQMRDGENLETVHLPYKERISVCVSSQAGCPMACQFCATGLSGFRRNLRPDEIIAQPLLALQEAQQRREVDHEYSAKDKTSLRPTHIVFMGMGEPLLNLSNVLTTIHLMHDEMGIPQRNITVSTVGIIHAMKKLADEKLQTTLAVSLHAPVNELRHRLIPTSLKTSVQDVIDASKYYVQTTGRRVTFEYVVLGGVNDSPQLARELAKLCKGWPCHVNLIPWNAVPEAGLEGLVFNSPQPETLREFRAILERAGIATTQRVQRGADVAGACGQLRAMHEVVPGLGTENARKFGSSGTIPLVKA